MSPIVLHAPNRDPVLVGAVVYARKIRDEDRAPAGAVTKLWLPYSRSDLEVDSLEPADAFDSDSVFVTETVDEIANLLDARRL